MQGSLRWAHLAHNTNLASASEAYDQSIRLLPEVAWIGSTAITQLAQLSPRIQSLGCDAAACMISLAQSEPHHEQRHLSHVIEVLDQDRSILWSQTSNFKRDLEDLRAVDLQLASELDLVALMRHRRSAERWEELVRQIRQLPNFHHFLLPPISMLRKAAVEGPVVIINSSQYRCDALISRQSCAYPIT
jgi:hypothetical protein